MAILAAILVALSANTVAGLQCYRCTNVEIGSDSSGLLRGLAGRSDSDPNCGSWPSGTNTVQCKNGEVCGSVSAQVSASSSFFGKLDAKTQVRGCMPPLDNSQLGGCRTGVSQRDTLLSGFLRVFGSSVQVSGEVCTCNFDLCTLCAGGVELFGICIKYWMLGLGGSGVILVLVLLICWCCGCCCSRS